MDFRSLLLARREQARQVVLRDEGRTLTNREFARTIGMNERSVRKVIEGQTPGTKIRQRLERGGGTFQQRAVVNGKETSKNITLPAGTPRYDIYTPTVRKQIKRTVRSAIENQIALDETPLFADRRGKRLTVKLQQTRAIKQAKRPVAVVRRRSH